MTDANDDAKTFLADPPPPRTRPLSAAEVTAAVEKLKKAAGVATHRGPFHERYVPGLSVAVVFRENGVSRVVHCAGYGVKHVDRAEAPGPHTLFPCASLSKPVSASLIAAGSGTNWDAPVLQRNGERYQLADAPNATTLRQWLSHTSGLPDHAGDLIEDMHPNMSRDEICQRIMQFQTGLTPGTFNYTNFGYTMGCLGAIHAFSGEWEDFALAGLRGLGMQQSTYAFTSAFRPDAGDRAFPHRGGFIRPQRDGGWAWNVVHHKEERNPSRQAPAGSLLSTANDMAAFIAAHLEGRFGRDYPPRHPEGATKEHPTVYSLGWNVADYSVLDDEYENAINASSFSHSGAFALGASTCLRIDPDAGVGIAVLTNGEPAGIPEVLVRLFFNHLYSQPGRLDRVQAIEIYREKFLSFLNAKMYENRENYPPRPAQPIPDSVPQGEVFRGHSDYYACDVVVDRNGDEVSLRMGDDWRFRLQYYDGGSESPRFIYQTIGENAVGISAVSLSRGGDGRFNTLVDHWLDLDPVGKDSGSGVGVIRGG